MWRPRLITVAMLAAAGGCSTVLGPGGGGETSRAAEPPASWESAILFQFRDSLSDQAVRFAARVELDVDGPARRTVTGDAVYMTESSFLRTPWYRLRVTEPRQMVIRVVLEYPHDARTVAEYPLTISPGEFYYVLFGVGTLEPEEPNRPYIIREMRKYAVPAEAIQQPSDSLWIGHYTQGRYCFACPG